jgi:hypothetical protein
MTDIPELEERQLWATCLAAGAVDESLCTT